MAEKFTRGSTWEVVNDLKGMPSHSKGGVDIKIGSDGVRFKHNSGKEIHAAYGLVLPGTPEGDPILEQKKADYISYMQNPEYIHRLSKEMYGINLWDSGDLDIKRQLGGGKIQKMRDNVTNIYKRKLSEVSNTSISGVSNSSDSHFNPETKSIKAVPDAAFHELSHSADWYYRNNIKGFEFKKDELIKKNLIENKEWKPGYYTIPVGTNEDKRLMEVINNDKYEYFNNPSEIKARVNSLRLQAIEKYGYNQSKPFNINDYPELKNNREYLELKHNLNLKEEDINELSKYIAANEVNKKDETTS